MREKEREPDYLTSILRKRKKLLAANSDCLTSKSISEVVDWYFEDTSCHFRGITMITLCTGWSVKKLMSNFTSVKFHQMNETESVGLLKSSWSFPTFAPNATNRAIFDATRVEFYIPFPPTFFHPLIKARELELQPSDIEKTINNNLAKLQNSKFQKVTIFRLQQHIIHTCHQFALSSNDIDFIIDKDFKQSAHSHYGHRSLTSIYLGLKQFIDSLHRDTFNRQSDFPYINTNERLGGNRVVSDSTVQEVFRFLIQRKNCHSNSLEKIRLNHNIYSTYVICILQLSILLRPSQMSFILLRNFELGFKSVVIQDKGQRSRRRIPICLIAQQVLNSYVDYLKSLSKKCRFLDCDISKIIDQTFESQAPIFHFFGESGIKIFTPETHAKMVFSEYYDLPPNWARHKVKTILLDEGESPQHVKRMMGHVENFEFNEAKFHSCQYADLVKISRTINDWFESLGVVNWQP